MARFGGWAMTAVRARCFPSGLMNIWARMNPVRAIDVFVDELDLAKLGFEVASSRSATGRPAYHPATLLKIYVYGYLNRVQFEPPLGAWSCATSRLVWLVRRPMPDFKTTFISARTPARPSSRAPP